METLTGPVFIPQVPVSCPIILGANNPVVDGIEVHFSSAARVAGDLHTRRSSDLSMQLNVPVRIAIGGKLTSLTHKILSSHAQKSSTEPAARRGRWRGRVGVH